LAWVEVDEAFELGEEVVAGSVRAVACDRAVAAQADDLFDAADADPREADLGAWARRLDVWDGLCYEPGQTAKISGGKWPALTVG
jgi:hypothetical protein